MPQGVALWVIFGVSVLGMLILDLGLINRKAHEVTLKEAIVWSIIWTIVALAFNGGVYAALGSQKAKRPSSSLGRRRSV
jgi:tellurite resistance protein TerC